MKVPGATMSGLILASLAHGPRPLRASRQAASPESASDAIGAVLNPGNHVVQSCGMRAVLTPLISDLLAPTLRQFLAVLGGATVRLAAYPGFPYGRLPSVPWFPAAAT